jgi:hypothetical protein
MWSILKRKKNLTRSELCTSEIQAEHIINNVTCSTDLDFLLRNAICISDSRYQFWFVRQYISWYHSLQTMYHPYRHAPQEWSQELYKLKAQQNNQNKITNLSASSLSKKNPSPLPVPVNSFMHNMIQKK